MGSTCSLIQAGDQFQSAAKSSQPPLFVNKDLLRHSHTHLLVSDLWLLPPGISRAEWLWQIAWPTKPSALIEKLPILLPLSPLYPLHPLASLWLMPVHQGFFQMQTSSDCLDKGQVGSALCSPSPCLCHLSTGAQARCAFVVRHETERSDWFITRVLLKIRLNLTTMACQFMWNTCTHSSCLTRKRSLSESFMERDIQTEPFWLLTSSLL